VLARAAGDLRIPPQATSIHAPQRPFGFWGVFVRIPVNVTADSGNVTDIPANVTEGRCCAF